MKLGLWMLAGSAVSALGITMFQGAATPLNVRLAVWLGMLAPMVAAVVSAVVFERAYRRRPESLTRVIGASFGIKMLFFGGYVVLVVKAGWVVPVPFVISFTSYFLALHITEAIHLRRLTTIK